MVDYTALATEVIEHATAHYDENGWDAIVECFTKAGIASELEAKGITTSRKAIAHFAQHVKAWQDLSDEINGA